MGEVVDMWPYRVAAILRKADKAISENDFSLKEYETFYIKSDAFFSVLRSYVLPE